MTLSIHYLIAIAILALILVLAGPTMRALRWIAEVHEAKQRRRHAVRRRERSRGYLPVHDEQWDPGLPASLQHSSLAAQRRQDRLNAIRMGRRV